VGEKKKKKKLRLIVVVLAIIIGGVYTYLSFVPLNLDHKIPDLRARIKPNLYGDINFNSLSMTVLPRPKLRIKEFTLTSKTGPVIEAGEIFIHVKLLPLLLKRVIIQQIAIGDADLFVMKSRDGTLNLKEIRKVKRLDIRLKKAVLVNCRLRLVDELPEETFQTELTGFTGNIYTSSTGYGYIAEGTGPEGSSIKVSGDAIKTNDGSWRLGGTMSAAKVESSLYSPYLRLFDKKIKLTGAIDGDLDFAFHKKATLKGQVSYSKVTLDLPKYRLDTIRSKFGSADLELTYSKENLRITLDNAELAMEGFDLFGSFSLGGPKGERSMKLSLYTSPGDYMAIRGLIPYKLLKKKMRRRFELFKIQGGKVEVAEFKIEGLLKDLKGSGILRDSKTFSLSLNLQGVNFKYHGFNDTYSDVFGRVEFRGPKITMKKLNGLYGKATINSLSGEVAGLTKRVTYRINLESSLELSESLTELKRLTRGSLDKISGTGKIAIKLQLSGGGGNGLNYSGKVDFLGATMNHASIPIKWFTSTKGSVGFENGLVVFHNLHALSGGSELFLNGTIEELKSPAPAVSLSIKGAIESIGLNSLLKEEGIKPIEYKYLMFYDVKVKGKKGALKIDSTLDLSHVEIKSIKGIKKARGYPVLIKVEAETKGNDTDIKRAIINLGGSAMELKGKVSTKPLNYVIEIPKSKIKLADLDSVLTLFIDDEWSSGEVNFNLKAERKKGSEKTLLNGEASIKNGYLRTVLLKNQLEEINLKASFNGNKAEITIDKVKIDNSSAQGRVTISDIRGRVIDFEVNSDYLESADLALRKREKDTLKKKKKSRLTGFGKINIRKGLMGKQAFKAFNTKVAIDQDYFNFDPLIFSLSEGLITGNAKIIKDPKNDKLFKTKLEVQNIDIEALVSGLGSKKKIVSGRLFANLDLYAKRGVKIKEGLGGKISFSSERGRLWKFTVITKIFSLVNIISINSLFEEGLKYNKISGTFNVADGIFNTEDVLFDSNSLRMSAYGKIDYASDKIDATLGFHPFVTIDKIINAIPLAGWIISGKNQSTITMYYEIDGPLKSPDVRAVPIKSLGKGIFGIIERTMKIPGQALTPGKVEEPSTGLTPEKEEDAEAPSD
jgi:uncharacterized protein YhdP